MSNRLVVSPDRVRVPRGARRPAAGVELRGLPRAWRCDRHVGTARRHSTLVRTPAQDADSAGRLSRPAQQAGSAGRLSRPAQHAGTARRHSTPVRTPAQHNAQEVGVGVCSTNTGGTSAPGWYFIRLARSAPRMSPLEW